MYLYPVRDNGDSEQKSVSGSVCLDQISFPVNKREVKDKATNDPERSQPAKEMRTAMN